MTIIYLDNNATTAIKPQVRNAMGNVLKLGALNPSSIHAKGREARSIIEETRIKVAKLAGFTLENANVIFTASGSEANNMAVKAVKNVDAIAVSEVEHVSILNAAKEAKIIPVDANGQVKLDVLEKIVGEAKTLVSIQLVNNETGVIQTKFKEIAEIVHKAKGYLHTDAVQAIGKLEYDLSHADLITISAHKFGGPQGAAALIARKGVQLSSLINGGGQEFGLRAGTHNVAAIAGFGTAIDLIAENISHLSRIEKIRNRLESEIVTIASDAKIYGCKTERVANTSCILMPGVKAETQLIEFDLSNIAVSSGSACSSGKILPSHVLKAMGVGAFEGGNAIRVSLGIDNTEEDVNEFINCWKGLYQRSSVKAA